MMNQINGFRAPSGKPKKKRELTKKFYITNTDGKNYYNGKKASKWVWKPWPNCPSPPIADKPTDIPQELLDCVRSQGERQPEQSEPVPTPIEDELVPIEAPIEDEPVPSSIKDPIDKPVHPLMQTRPSSLEDKKVVVNGYLARPYNQYITDLDTEKFYYITMDGRRAVWTKWPQNCPTPTFRKFPGFIPVNLRDCLKNTPLEELPIPIDMDETATKNDLANLFSDSEEELQESPGKSWGSLFTNLFQKSEEEVKAPIEDNESPRKSLMEQIFNRPDEKIESLAEKRVPTFAERFWFDDEEKDSPISRDPTPRAVSFRMEKSSGEPVPYLSSGASEGSLFDDNDSLFPSDTSSNFEDDSDMEFDPERNQDSPFPSDFSSILEDDDDDVSDVEKYIIPTENVEEELYPKKFQNDTGAGENCLFVACAGFPAEEPSNYEVGNEKIGRDGKKYVVELSKRWSLKP